MVWDAPDIAVDSTAALRDVIDKLLSGDMALSHPDARRSYLFLAAMTCPGHLHILFRAYQMLLQSLPEWVTAEKHFRSLASFLSKKGYRDRFSQKCLEAAPTKRPCFKHWTGGSFTWRWEKLQIFLQQLLVVLDSMLSFWNPANFTGMHDEDGGGSGPVVAAITAALAFPDLEWYCHYAYATGAVVDVAAGWLEGCRCHPRIMQQRASKRAKVQRCPWAGRRAVEMAMGKPAEIAHQFCKASTTGLAATLGRMSAGARARCLSSADRANSVFTEEWLSKLDFFKHWPYKALLLVAPYFGGTAATSKGAAADLLAWFDSLQDPGMCHRALATLVTPGSVGREQLTVHLQVDRPLHTFSHAFRDVIAYAFASLVERRLEGVHARIGIHAKQANSARRLPSTVCAGLRWSEVEALMTTDNVRSFVLREWNRLDWSKVSLNMLSKVELSMMSWSAKLELMYMYDVQSQFENDRAQQHDVKAWAAAVSRGIIPPDLPHHKGRKRSMRLLPTCSGTRRLHCSVLCAGVSVQCRQSSSHVVVVVCAFSVC